MPHRQPLLIYALSTNFVLEIEGGAVANGKIRVAPRKKADNENQLWSFVDGIIASYTNPDLVLEHPLLEHDHKVIVNQRKDTLHNWQQKWELHHGFIRSAANNQLVLDVVHQSAEAHAYVCVWKLREHGDHESQQWAINTIGGQPYHTKEPLHLTYATEFDPSYVAPRVAKLWNIAAVFGEQTTSETIFYNEIVSNRYCLINGVQVLRDEIQFAFQTGENLHSCAADLTLPSVVTTLAHTNCGDRFNHGFASSYDSIIAKRFASMAKDGSQMTEDFSPAGGGTDDGGVLAHVTVGHQLGEQIRTMMYDGNKYSYALINIDLMTHVGCDTINGKLVFGKARESTYREPRDACGAVRATLNGYNPDNTVHNRIKRNLGDANYAVLQKGIVLDDGTDITLVVAAAIIVLNGLRETCYALETNELDERSVAHVTACTSVNGPDNNSMFYFARATVFGGQSKIQGFGTIASKYSGSIVENLGQKRLVLTYDGKHGDQIDVKTIEYTVKGHSSH